VVYPYFGSAVAKLMGAGSSGLPAYVWIKPDSGGFVHKDAGFLGPKFGALAFGDGKAPPNMERHASISDQDAADREELQALVNQRYVQGRRDSSNEASSYVYGVARTLMRRRDLFDESTFSQQDKDRYGSHQFGRHMLQGRKMLEAGVRFVKVNSYGWDTHGDNFNGHGSRMPKYDQALAAMIEDLQASGQLEHTLVISLSEFGRTPRINGHIGRDHWPEAWSITMAGCGINKGIVVGKTNAEGTWVENEQYDIGHMFHTWFKALGIDPTETEYLNKGQPLPICHDDMSEIKELLS
jgi:hypothetical protein